MSAPTSATSDTTVAAWVDDRPILVTDVEDRLAALRARDRATALPRADSREGRQLRRWVTQVLVVERLCAAEVHGSGPATQGAETPGPLAATVPDRAEAAAVGSIVAAAWASHPDVARAADRVTQDVALDEATTARAHRLGAGPTGIPVWSDEELLRSARIEAFARWLARRTHERVRREEGYEHPGDSNQPDNLHEH